jgi:ubiquitin-associated SH3 domain-containing protein
MTAAHTPVELIVYACPVGELARQLASFYETSRSKVGENAAHRFPPHCTLLGFFHDDRGAIPIYTAALATALDRAQPSRPNPPISIDGAHFDATFHYLKLESPWLIDLCADFIATAGSSTRRDALRPKTWLHLSLAYEFQPGHGARLKELAEAVVDPSSEVTWELRLYERLPDRSWDCHASWPIR